MTIRSAYNGRDRQAVNGSRSKDLRERLWVDDDLSKARDRASEVERDRTLLLKQYTVVARDNHPNVKAALELANAIAAAEADRETNLNTRAAAVASVAALIVSISAAVAKAVFATQSSWTETTRDVTAVLFLATLVFVASAMVMAVVGVLRPKRGQRTKNAIGEAFVNVCGQMGDKDKKGGDEALAAGVHKRIEVFWLDRLLRAIPEWHYRNRSKARWLRRAWMFLMLGTLLIGSASVTVLAKLRLPADDEKVKAVQPPLTLWTTIGVIALVLVVVWLLLKFDLVGAGRRPWGCSAKVEEEKERKHADEEAALIVDLLTNLSPQAVPDLVPRQESETVAGA
jgi:hypothetical protein